MTQDCSNSLPAAHGNNEFPKGISITKADTGSDLGIENVSNPIDSLPWGYLFIHNKKAAVFEREMAAYNMENPEFAHACFVHRSFVYKQRTETGG